MCSSDKIDASMYYFSQGMNYSGDNGGVVFPNSGVESYYFCDSHYGVETSNSSLSMDCSAASAGEDNYTNSIIEAFTDGLMESRASLSKDRAAVLQGKNLQHKVQSEMPVVDSSTEDKNYPSLENSKKRSRVSGEVQQRRNVKSKMNQKLVLATNNDAYDNVRHDQPRSRSCCLEDDSDASQGPNRGTNSSSGSKETAAMNLNAENVSRGSATDPQSLYARRRRERINERLRILQNLVPSGTKVDVSTMLEEAVLYVKFLQLQIKLLSSGMLHLHRVE